MAEIYNVTCECPQCGSMKANKLVGDPDVICVDCGKSYRPGQAIQKQVCSVADQILSKLGKQTKGNVHIAIAALSVAMCSLARADGMLFNELQEVLAIAFEQINGD